MGDGPYSLPLLSNRTICVIILPMSHNIHFATLLCTAMLGGILVYGSVVWSYGLYRVILSEAL